MNVWARAAAAGAHPGVGRVRVLPRPPAHSLLEGGVLPAASVASAPSWALSSSGQTDRWAGLSSFSGSEA